jgi:hypothetical protein
MASITDGNAKLLPYSCHNHGRLVRVAHPDLFCYSWTGGDVVALHKYITMVLYSGVNIQVSRYGTTAIKNCPLTLGDLKASDKTVHGSDIHGHRSSLPRVAEGVEP